MQLSALCAAQFSMLHATGVLAYAVTNSNRLGKLCAVQRIQRQKHSIFFRHLSLLFRLWIVQCRRPPLLLLLQSIVHSILLLLTAQVSPCEYAFVSRFHVSRCIRSSFVVRAHRAGVCRALATGIIFNCTFAFADHKSAANRISNDRKNNRPMPQCNWSWNLLFAAWHIRCTFENNDVCKCSLVPHTVFHCSRFHSLPRIYFLQLSVECTSHTPHTLQRAARDNNFMDLDCVCECLLFMWVFIVLEKTLERRKIELSLCVVLAEFDVSDVSLSAIRNRSASMLNSEQRIDCPDIVSSLHKIAKSS